MDSSTLITVALILVGFLLLYYGAEFLISGAEKLAKNLNISKAIVGVVVVAFGTSAPELFVNLICACRDDTGLALSNISGSNLTNLCVGFGLIGIFFGISFKVNAFKLDLVYFILGPLIIAICFLITSQQFLPVWTIFILFPLMGYFLYKAMLRFNDPNSNNVPDSKDIVKGIGMFLGGILGLYIGGEFVVHNSKAIGASFGISEAILGLTVVAGGTSIPDVMASVVAAKRGENEIAIGNIIGSNIFNIFFVLSSTLLVSFSDMVSDFYIFFDYGIVTILSIIFGIYVTIRKRIDPLIGIILLMCYIAYYILRVSEQIPMIDM
jgi:cation:H+ antiporter